MTKRKREMATFEEGFEDKRLQGRRGKYYELELTEEGKHVRE
jgi:hypothetical protein